MSLQVCHCGWSKVTSVHGLRTHQGMKGCTPKGVKISQSDQQYLQDFVGAAAIQLDVKLGVRTSIKTDTTDYYSDLSLHICHCGWSKMTTYQGLRIHQGKMGCTPKGMRIPKEEQYKWNKQQEADENRRKTAERVVVKTESLSPRRNRSTNSAAATVQESYMPPSADARRSSKRSTKSKSGQQQFSSFHQVNRPVREYPNPTYPERDKKIKRQTSLRNTDSRAGEYCSNDYAAAVKEEPKSPFAVSQPSFQRDTKSMSRQDLQDFSTDVQMNRNVQEPPTLVPVVRLKQKHREGQTSSQVNRQLFREHPASMYMGNAVRPKEENLQNQILSQNTDRAVEEYWSIKSSSSKATTPAALKEEPKLSAQPSLQRATKSNHQMQDSSMEVKVNPMVRKPLYAPPMVPAVPPIENSRKQPTPSQLNRSVKEHRKTPPPVLPKKKDTFLFKVRQERITSELQQKLQKREEKLAGITTVEPVCESVQDATTANTQTAPAAAEVPAKVDPATLYEAAQPDFSTGMTVKELAQMFSASIDQESKNEGGEQKPSQVKLVAREFSASTVREAVQPQEKNKNKQGMEEAKLLAPEFLASTARETAVQPQKDDEEHKLSQNEPPSINSTTAAKVVEEPKPSVTTQCSLKKVSNIQGDLQLQVNRSVRKHPTTPPPVLPKKRNTLLHKVKESTLTSEQQQKHQEGKTSDIKPAETVHEKVADTANTNTQVSAKENPPSLYEAAQPDFCTGMKVKELAQMFSATTEQKPKNDQVEQKPSQLLAQRFSDVTASKTAIQPKDKEAQAKLLASRFSASTVRETVGQPKENDGGKNKLPQKQLPNPTNVATRMNLAAEATVEKDPKSSCETAQLSDVCAGVKVTDLIRMFSATTRQETDVQTKGEKREQNLHRW